MKILIIEDEEHNAKRLKRLLLETERDIEVVGHTKSIAATVAYLNENEQPDLILVDIRLSDGLSFEIFRQIDVQVPLIFTTAYDEYALQAFKFNSIDYLLKPIELEELSPAIDKAIRNSKRTVAPDRELVSSLLSLMEKGKPAYRRRFLVPFRDEFVTIDAKDIDHIHSEHRITRLILKNGKEEIIPQTLEDLETQLDPEAFFRANRQFIISLDSIGSIHNYFNSKLKVRLTRHPDADVIISREKAPLLKSWLDR